jgi:hypothetical protein
MATSRKRERHHLTDDEFELVEQTHQPGIAALDDDVLAELLKLVRERRDRAADIGRRQRREMRGKSAPRGASPVEGDVGSRIKLGILAAAVKRINSERARRQTAGKWTDLVSNAKKALALKKEAADDRPPKAGRTAGKGMRAKTSKKAPEIARPDEVGRVSQAVKTAQAKRDAK